MVLRLKTRESRSLPGLPSASVTLLLTIFVSSTLNLIVAETSPPVAQALGGFEFLEGRSGRCTSQTAPIPQDPADGRCRSAGPDPDFPPPRPGRDGRSIVSGSTGPTGPRRSQRLTAGWSSPVARQAHNLKVAGSNPAPATKKSPVDQGLNLALPGFFMCANPFRLIATHSLYFSIGYISSGIRYDFAQNPPCHMNGT